MHICHETAEVLREADAIVTGTVMNKKIAQCFAVLLPVSTDETSARPYSIVIRAVVTSDYMTARAAARKNDAFYHIVFVSQDNIFSFHPASAVGFRTVRGFCRSALAKVRIPR